MFSIESIPYRALAVQLVFTFFLISCDNSSREQLDAPQQIGKKMFKFQVLYPQPSDPAQFDLDYAQHLQLLDSLMGYPDESKPYTVTKFDQEVFGSTPPFYQLFTLSFESREALEATIGSKEMEEAGADAARISSGGAPVVLIGQDASVIH